MAEADWTLVDGSLAATSVARGVSSGFTPPNGGGSYVAGFNTLVATTGFTGFFVNRPNFAPLVNAGGSASGGSIRFAVQKVTAAVTGFTPMAFICLRAGSAVAPNPAGTDTGYLMGLENSNPYRIVFVKAAPGNGLQTAAVRRSSSASFTAGQWHHLRMDAIVNPNGDVILRFFSNNLVANPVTAPVWTAIAGMTDFTDDAFGVNSGSAPLSGGFAGWGMWANTNGRFGLLDHVEVFRQT